MDVTNNICFLIPLFGKIPPYFNLFLKTAYINQKYSFIFFSDLNLEIKAHSNIKLIKLNFVDYKLLIESKTGVKPLLNNYYKMVDYKPAYGLIFKDYITSFKFWGILDIDLILGKICDFIDDDLLTRFDIISVRKYWLSGSFALFRNCDQVNNLFKKSIDWEKVFSSNRLFRFTECGTIKGSDRSPINEIKKGISFSEIETDIESFMRVITDQEKLNGLRVYFNDFVNEGLNRKEILYYREGELFFKNLTSSSSNESQKFLHYHFIREKDSITFSYPKWKNIPDEFYITEYGFIKRKYIKYLTIIKINRFIISYLNFIISKLPIKIIKKISKF